MSMQFQLDFANMEGYIKSMEKIHLMIINFDTDFTTIQKIPNNEIVVMESAKTVGNYFL